MPLLPGVEEPSPYRTQTLTILPKGMLTSDNGSCAYCERCTFTVNMKNITGGCSIGSCRSKRAEIHSNQCFQLELGPGGMCKCGKFTAHDKKSFDKFYSLRGKETCPCGKKKASEYGLLSDFDKYWKRCKKKRKVTSDAPIY